MLVFLLAACEPSPSGNTADDSATVDDTATNADDSAVTDDSAVADDSAETDDSAVTDDSGTDDTGTTPDPRFVATGVSVLDGTDMTLPYDDLEALVPIIGEATLVGIGEPVHYSNDFAEVRARVIPWLVEERGFRAIAFEAPWVWAETGRPYIEDDEGELVDAMSSLGFDLWMSDATAELIEWVHDWNLAHPDDEVTWFAYDIQSFADDFPLVRDIVRATDPKAEAKLWEGVTDCLGGTYLSWEDFYALDDYGYNVYIGKESYTEGQRIACQVGLDAIQDWVDGHHDPIVAAVGDEGPTLADVALISLSAVQKEFAWWDASVASHSARDEGMATVLQRLWALRAPDKSLAIWAHNAHLYRESESLVYADFEFKSMGQWLSDGFGDGYVPIAQFCSNTTYNWAGTGPTTVTADPKSFEAAIEALGPYTSLVVDVGAATEAGVLPDEQIEFGDPGLSIGLPAYQVGGAIWLKTSDEIEMWDGW